MLFKLSSNSSSILPFVGVRRYNQYVMRLFSAKCTSTARLDEKTAVITGSNTGIGKMTAKDFFERGARVIMACRSVDKANQAVEEIKQLCTGKADLGALVVVPLDLTSLKSVRDCAEGLLKNEKRIDILVNNAGIMACPFAKTTDGFEMQIGTNHLGHFLFTLLLLPKIIESTSARIVNVSSSAHAMTPSMDFTDLNWENKRYKSLDAYQKSKLANVLFTKELVRKLQENNITGINTYSLHPGVILTELGRHLNDTYFPGFRQLVRYTFGWFLKTPEQGAQTTIYCAVDEKCANETGLYYSDCKVTKPSDAVEDVEAAKKLWELSCKLVGLDDKYNPFAKYSDMNKT